jgi:hypothetical protein
MIYFRPSEGVQDFERHTNPVRCIFKSNEKDFQEVIIKIQEIHMDPECQVFIGKSIKELLPFALSKDALEIDKKLYETVLPASIPPEGYF